MDVLCAGIIVADHVCTPISHLPAAGELVLADQLLLTIGGCAANVGGRSGQDGRPRRRGRPGRRRRLRPDRRRHAARARRRRRRCCRSRRGVDTSQTLIVNVAGQDRRFIHTFGANADFQRGRHSARPCRTLQGAVPGRLPADARRCSQEELAAVFAAARQAGVKTVLDVVTPGPGDYLPQLEPLLPHVDVFLPNNHEAELITGETDPLRQAELFHRLGAGTVIITHGRRRLGAGQRQDCGCGPACIRCRSWTAAAAATPSPPATSTACCTAWHAEDCLRVASASVRSACAIGTTPGVFTAPSARRLCANIAWPSNGFEVID